MKIAGIQKLTLLDFPGRCAATVFTPGCNLRCPFCHNASLVEPESVKKAETDGTFFSEDQVLEILKERFGRLTGLAMTGGEPLMQDGLLEFLRRVKDLGYEIKLDTNGTYPQKLSAALASGLIDYVAMDFKNSRSSYAKTVGLAADAADTLYNLTLQSAEIIAKSSAEHEFRTTVSAQLHTIEDIKEIAKSIAVLSGNASNEKYFIQNFTDSGDILGGGFTAHPKEVLHEMLAAAQQFLPSARLRGV